MQRTMKLAKTHRAEKNKCDKSQEQAKRRANFLALNVTSCCIPNWVWVVKENGGGTNKFCLGLEIFLEGWRLKKGGTKNLLRVGQKIF